MCYRGRYHSFVFDYKPTWGRFCLSYGLVRSSMTVTGMNAISRSEDDLREFVNSTTTQSRYPLKEKSHEDTTVTAMSLKEYRSSPLTVQFTYSQQPFSSNSLPTVSIIIDIITSLLQSTLCLLLVQWSTIHLDTNRILGPVLRYLRHLLPYNDIRIVHITSKSWEFPPLGVICIMALALFLFFSKSTPIGNMC